MMMRPSVRVGHQIMNWGAGVCSFVKHFVKFILSIFFLCFLKKKNQIVNNHSFTKGSVFIQELLDVYSTLQAERWFTFVIKRKSDRDFALFVVFIVLPIRN